MKVNFKNLIIKDLDWKEAQDLNKHIWNAVNKFSDDLNLIRFAQDIYDNKDIDIAKTELEQIKAICEKPEIWFYAYIKHWIIQFIDNLK